MFFFVLFHVKRYKASLEKGGGICEANDGGIVKIYVFIRIPQSSHSLGQPPLGKGAFILSNLE